MQAPNGSNSQGWQWVFVEDAEKKKAIGDIYLSHARGYLSAPGAEYPEGDTRGERVGLVRDSATYLAEHMHEAPVLMIPCIFGREDKQPLGGVRLGVAVSGGLEFLPGAALPRPGLLLDHASSAGRR